MGESSPNVLGPSEQLGGLPRERREALCPLEAGHGQVDSVVPCEFEGMSAVDGCTRSLGGIETPEPLVVARVPSASVPVCVCECAHECERNPGYE